MKKRVFSTLIAAALVLALLPAGAFAATVSTDEASQVLAALNIMVGDQNGNLNLSNNVTRAEFTKMAVMASPLGEGVGGSTNVSPYTPTAPSARPIRSPLQRESPSCCGCWGMKTATLPGRFPPGR